MDKPSTPLETLSVSLYDGGMIYMAQQTPSMQEMIDANNEPLSPVPAATQQRLQTIFGKCSDLVYRTVHLPDGTTCLIVYLESLLDSQTVSDQLLIPLMRSHPSADFADRFPIGYLSAVSTLGDAVTCILQGQIAVFADGIAEAFLLSLSLPKEREIGESPTEPAIRGPRAAFVEALTINLALLRRRLHTPQMKVEELSIGRLSKTKVVITYLEGIADSAIIEEVKQRINTIELDGILESGYIEELIEDASFSPFPQMLSTERPDVVVSGMLEGKIALLMDSTPFALLMPVTFWSGLQASEDYYIRFPIAASVRFIRLAFSLLALLLPSLYIAITTFHHQLIPTNLLISISASRENTPFPAFVEALMMEVTFEALREAGVRLPRPSGQAISIVGALVIGQAAVQAGLVSTPMVIVVSLTAIASFTIPRTEFANSIRLLRFPMMGLAGVLGLYGISLGLLAILVHVTSLRSFGIPYFAPIAPLGGRGLRDALIRAPLATWQRKVSRRKKGQRNEGSA